MALPSHEATWKSGCEWGHKAKKCKPEIGKPSELWLQRPPSQGLHSRASPQRRLIGFLGAMLTCTKCDLFALGGLGICRGFPSKMQRSHIDPSPKLIHLAYRGYSPIAQPGGLRIRGSLYLVAVDFPTKRRMSFGGLAENTLMSTQKFSGPKIRYPIAVKLSHAT